MVFARIISDPFIIIALILTLASHPNSVLLSCCLDVFLTPAAYLFVVASDLLFQPHHRARSAWNQPPRHQVLVVLPGGRLSFLPMHRVLTLC